MDVASSFSSASETLLSTFSVENGGHDGGLQAAVEALNHAPIVIGLDVVSMLIAVIIGYIGVTVMAYGVLRSIWEFVMSIGKHEYALPMIRINLGKHLALGLEFLVGKDIIESIVHPTWDDLGKLAAIIVLRTVVTVFLARELKEVEEEMKLETAELELEERRRNIRKTPAHITKKTV